MSIRSISLPDVSAYRSAPATTLKLVLTHQEAGSRSRELGWSAIATCFLLTLFLSVAGILHIHFEHGYAGALFTASLIGILMGINIFGYMIVVYFAGVIERKHQLQGKDGDNDKLLVDDDDQ